MTHSVYRLNKGINKTLEFKGLKAQYIPYLGVGLVILFLLFAVLYVCGVNAYLVLLLTGSGAAGLFFYTSRLSRKYGEHGMMKKTAHQSVPGVITCRTRRMSGWTTTPKKTEL